MAPSEPATDAHWHRRPRPGHRGSLTQKTALRSPTEGRRLTGHRWPLLRPSSSGPAGAAVPVMLTCFGRRDRAVPLRSATPPHLRWPQMLLRASLPFALPWIYPLFHLLCPGSILYPICSALDLSSILSVLPLIYPLSHLFCPESIFNQTSSVLDPSSPCHPSAPGLRSVSDCPAPPP